MSKKYRIKYKFPLDKTAGEAMKISLDYWKKRDFKCHLLNNKIIGKRGSVIGNLFSFDMTKLICELNVEFEESNVLVEFIVNGKFQDITPVNLASFKIEQLLFPYFLENTEPPSSLNSFLKFRRQAAIKWTFSFMTLGRELSDDLKVSIESLANGNELPQVEIE